MTKDNKIDLKPLTKTFKEYYQDAEYRKRHLDYIKEKVQCSCGCITARCNMSVHKKTAKHINIMKQLEKKKQEQIDKKRLKIEQVIISNLSLLTYKELKRIFRKII